MPGTGRTGCSTYSDELRRVLMLDGADPVVREQVVAEVEAHVRDTGEDPVDVFGPPGVYAAQYAQPRAYGTASAGTPRLDGAPIAHTAPHQELPGWLLVVGGFVGVLGAVCVGALLASWARQVAGAPDAVLAAIVLGACLVLPGLAHRAVRPSSSWLGTVFVVLATAVGVTVALGLALTVVPALAMTGITTDGFLSTLADAWMLACIIAIVYGVLGH